MSDTDLESAIAQHPQAKRQYLDLVGKLEKAEAELAALKQITGELCDKCGWAMKFPNEQCRCELEKELAEYKAAVKEFCQESDWAAVEWRKQPHIQKLFDLGERK